MNDDNELDPVARLRAADPAVGVEPHPGFADEVIARATSDSTADPVTAAPVADLASERARRRPRWLPIAAVAASIAIIGAAGYGLGASTGGATNLAGGAAAPISLQTGANQEGAVQGGAAVPSAGFGADQKMAGPGPVADSMMMPYPYGFGRNDFTSSGLATTEGTALAYTYDARAASNAETVTALAAALGVDGTAELKDGSWIVGPQDGTAPYLSVSLDGTLGFSYSNPLINPWNCVEGADVA
ncbi:MAG TPA: hypothetical protein VM430_13385, partial [Microbacterium sp.]|nr:hypothetical protein [Microbacterium sp.]